MFEPSPPAPCAPCACTWQGA